MSIRSENLSPKQARKRWRQLETTGKRVLKEFHRAQRHGAATCPHCRGTVIAFPSFIPLFKSWKCERCGYRFWSRRA